MRIAAIIVAAGRGSRAGAGMPKQWRAIAGKRVADWTVFAFADHPAIDQIVLVHHADDSEQIAAIAPSVICVTGGATRDGSVRNGLEALADAPPDLVLIHDVARPCVPASVIDAVSGAIVGRSPRHMSAKSTTRCVGRSIAHSFW